jgi:hypothetical protein
MQHLQVGLEMSIVVLTNYVIFVYLHVFSQFKILLDVNIACVMFNMWFLT